MKLAIWPPLLALLLASCNPTVDEGVRKNDLKKDVELVTDFGTVVFRLSDESPLHRNNFIRLVKQEFYDSLIFHRVINDFLLQTGDPDSRTSAPGDVVGATDLPYTIPPEFTPNLFHKRGAINAARSDNPERASSSTQFTIIQGRLYNDSTLAVAEGRINGWLEDNRLANSQPYQELLALLQQLEKEMPGSDSLSNVQERKQTLETRLRQDTPRYTIPEHHREAYKTIGGAAHLDQNYTVFGEVISGMDVVDRIAAVPTDGRDRPLEDVRIVTARLVKRR
jgi:cyclophilin family peptidyl-prolyl cis-trans isomerase